MELKPVLKYPGAKWRIAKWILEHMPAHTTYLEPFFGSGAVFFNKKPSKVETINDIDGNVVNLFKVIRERPAELARLIEMTPWARKEHEESFTLTGDPLEDARRTLIQYWQTHGASIGRGTTWRTVYTNSNRVTELWDKLPERIINTAKRLKHAQIENRPALEIIRRYKHEDTLIYADPPYPLKTRNGRMYAHEMTVKEHEELLEALNEHPGAVLLSGYDCELYNTRLKHWTRKTKKTLAEKGQMREEVLWLNPVASELNEYRQLSLLDKEV